MIDFSRQKLIAGALLAWLVMSPAILTGCQFFNKKPAAANATDDSGDDNKPAAPPTVPDDMSPHPLIDNYRPISVKMADGLKIVGTLYIPGISPYALPKPKPAADDADSDAAGGGDGGDDSDAPKKPPAPPVIKTHYPLIILLHMLSDDRWVWNELPKQLVAAGYAVLALDMRGHGDSVYMGKTLMVWRQFDPGDWPKMVDDIPAVMAYIHKKPDFAMVNTDDVGIVGASIGANVAINAAHQKPDAIKALVLMSPGLEYHGIETFDPVTDLNATAMYYLASKEDEYATMSSEKLYKFTQGKKKIQIYQDIGHGTDMLTNDPEIGKQIVQWLVGILPPPGAKPAEAAGEAKPPSEANPKVEKSDAKDDKAAQKETAAEKPAEKKPEKPAPKKTEKADIAAKKENPNPAKIPGSTTSTSTAKTSPPTSTTTTPPAATTTTTPSKSTKAKQAVKASSPNATPPPLPVDKPSNRFDTPLTNINSAPPPPAPATAPLPSHSGPYSQ